jgi:hypothetical protein
MLPAFQKMQAAGNNFVSSDTEAPRYFPAMRVYLPHGQTTTFTDFAELFARGGSHLPNFAAFATFLHGSPSVVQDETEPQDCESILSKKAKYCSDKTVFPRHTPVPVWELEPL